MGNKHYVILGAGPCGLCAAWELTEHGEHVTVIEKDSTPGGLCKTIRRNGYNFDLGGHRFVTADNMLASKIKSLLGSDLLVTERKSSILFNGQEFSYPLKPLELLSRMNPHAFLILAGGYMLSRSKALLDAKRPLERLDEWIISKYGDPLYRLFFQPFSTKLWGIDPSQISSDWASRRIPTFMFFNVFLERSAKNHRIYAKRFFYPKHGIGQIFEKISEKIKENGGVILHNSSVQKINVRTHRVTSILIKTPSGSTKIECDYLISTIPITDLTDKIYNGGQLQSSLTFRSLRFMNIMLDSHRISDKTWRYVSDRTSMISRIQEPRNRSIYNAPPSKTSLMLEIPCAFGDPLWKMDDGTLLQRCLDELELLNINVSKTVEGFFSTFAKHAYPVYKTGYKKHVNAIQRKLSQYKNLHSCGRQGMFNYLFMDQSMSIGIHVARSSVEKSQEH